MEVSILAGPDSAALRARYPPLLPACEIDSIIAGVRTWERLRDARVLLTGATGFIGKWLLASLLEANRQLGLNVTMVALSRDPAGFLRRFPILAEAPELDWVSGDVRSFNIAGARFDYVVHGATEVIDQGPPLDTFDTIVAGTRRVLDLAVAAGVGDVLLLSSGAVYGRQPFDLPLIPEDFPGAPDISQPGAAYGEGKRVGDWLGALYSGQGLIRAKSARVYAQVGPHMPLDKQFAIANFIGDALAGRPIEIRGDGSTVRSYMYGVDLAVWLWTILLEGQAGAAYNVGSEEGIALGDLARRVNALVGSDAGVAIRGAPVPRNHMDRYVPSTRRAREDLALDLTVGLDDAILGTVRWHQPA